jgi:hypothetical protein
LGAAVDAFLARADLAPSSCRSYTQTLSRLVIELGAGLEAISGLDVDHEDGTSGPRKQEIRDVTTLVVSHEKGLRRDSDDIRVRIGEEQTCQFESALIYDVAASRRRPVQAREVTLPAVRANLPPRHRRENEICRQRAQRDVVRRAISKPYRRHGGHLRRSTDEHTFDTSLDLAVAAS